MKNQQLNNLHGIMWMGLMTLCGAISIAIVRALGDDGLHPFQLVFLLNFFCLIFLLPLIAGRRIVIKTKRWKLYSLRACLEFVGWSLSFYAVSLIELPIHTALAYMTPLILHSLAVIILRESSNIHRWIALFIGIGGVFVIIFPDIGKSSAESNIYLAAAALFISSSCFATCGLIIKKLTVTENVSTITFYMAFLTMIVSLPTAVVYWKIPTDPQWFLAIAVGMIALMQQYAVTKAFAKAEVTVVLPVTFTSLVYSSIFAYIFFDEIVTIWTVSGAIIVLSGVLYAVYHAKKVT